MAVPTLTVLFGILLHSQDEALICTKMEQFRAELNFHINAPRSGTIALRGSIHRDMIGLHHERLAVVEARQNP